MKTKQKSRKRKKPKTSNKNKEKKLLNRIGKLKVPKKADRQRLKLMEKVLN